MANRMAAQAPVFRHGPASWWDATSAEPSFARASNAGCAKSFEQDFLNCRLAASQ